MTQKLYVTFREESSSFWNKVTETWDENPLPGRLGYAAVYNPGNEKTDKKNKAQFDWARYTLDEQGNFENRTNYRHEWPDGKVYRYEERTREGMMQLHPITGLPTNTPILKQAYDVSPLKESLKPAILDNVPLEGFKVASTVSRYSTSNKLWRILDPRGFELEISTKNMEDLIMSGTIVEGVFLGKLIWDFGKNGIGKAILKRA